MSERQRLTDADMIAHLRRRSTGPRVESDLSVRDFVAGVDAKIDADSRPVRNRRRPALAGLAGAAAIILVLVVALPAFRPGLSETPSPGETQTPASIAEGSATPGVPTIPSSDPSATPNASELRIMTATEFAEALRANELDGQQVLVDGGIERRQILTLPLVCYPGVVDGRTCYLGELEGVEPVIAVSSLWLAAPESENTTRFAEPRIEWPHWWFPRTPIRGVLVLSVRGGTVDYLGRAHPNGEALTWSVAEARAVDPGSLAPDEILLVGGWLTGLGSMLDCASPPNNVVAGLPERWCANWGWLMDDASRSVSSAEDRSSGIELQDKAYYEFALAPDPPWIGMGDGEPRQGTYALSPRLEGWCRNSDPPCWQWNVVGRVADDPSGVPSRTIECGHLSLGIPGSSSGILMSVRDETGLVEDCIAGWTSTAVSGVVVENPLPNAVNLDVSWPGTMCDLSTALTFQDADAGYDLVGETQTEPCPDDSPVRHSLMIGMAQAVPAESVRVSINGAIGTRPTPTPTPDSAVIPCTTDDHHATILDQTGYIDACRTVEGTVAVELVTLLDHFGSGEMALRILWTGSACDDTPVFRLLQSGMRFTLEGELFGEPCGPENVPYEVQFLLNTDLMAQSIDASMRRVAAPTAIPSPTAPVASAEFETAVGTFEIAAQATKATYRTGEPIDIAGAIVWKGAPAATLAVLGGDTDAAEGLVHFGWEQLDGDHLQIGPIFGRSCQSTTLEAGVPVTGVIAKETGNFGDREHDAFWRGFFATPEFTLPPGRYRVMARALFSVGECRGDQIGMYVPIFVNVTE